MRLIATLIALFACGAAPAAASVGPCVPGGDPDYAPLCTFWNAKVTAVADGDTIEVDIAGDGSRARRRIRLTGVNAMELTRYSHNAALRQGDCHGVEATSRLEQILRRGRMRVRLAARTRPATPVNYDAPRNDRFNVNGEYVQIVNRSGVAVPLGGWYFRDSGLRRYTFQPGAVAPAGGGLTLRMGYGADTADELHWGLDTPPFDNPSRDWRATGDGGYLFDPRGNLRAWSIYN